ncbi:urease accessory protein UreD [Granulosicoccus sp. 3-233]|uniref:urease accessory protein UreD n=1 Tax=Granulosicoccus sp. 3-233 TaxID=3417969 RepID=UPI003D3301ED
MYSRHETAKPLTAPNVSRQRINAAGHVASRHRPNGPSALAALDQQGSARIRLPNSFQGPLQAVLINTAGGLTGDDDIRWSATAGESSRLVISTAACEKLYRTHGPAARQQTRLTVENGARLDWLPQETIVFNGSSLERSLEVDVAGDATALIVESLVLGRHAMQESVERLQLHDCWRIRRDGRLLHAEDLRLQLDDRRHARRPSMLHHYSALSTLVLVSPESSDSLHMKGESVRRLLPDTTSTLQAATTVMKHRLVIRVLATDSQSLRKFLIPCIEHLSDRMSIPQVWNV